jgi:methylglutaconyl-CoA hydratase
VLGKRQTRRYLQTAEVLDAQEAEQIGLLHEVVAADKLDERIDLALKQLRAGAPGARAIAKEVADDIAGRSIEDALLSEIATLVADVRANLEAREGLSAFLDKRNARAVHVENAATKSQRNG